MADVQQEARAPVAETPRASTGQPAQAGGGRSAQRQALKGKGFAEQTAMLKPPAAPGAATAAATPEMKNFLAAKHDLVNFHSSTGMGLFDASYDGASGTLNVVVRCKYNFKNGSKAKFPKAKPEDLAWTEDAKTKWQSDFASLVSTGWAGKHSFACGKKGLESLTARITVRVLAVEKDWHYRMDVTRIPKGEFSGSAVSPYSKKRGNNYAQLDSEDLSAVSKGAKGKQHGAIHEFGHMIGLDDEYGSGTDIDHKTLVKNALGKDLVKGTTDDVMSCGDVVGKQHYVVFLEALKKATGIQEWKFQ